ncbi:DNA polymerase, beta-like region [Gallibacterium anatis UMN179]|uniref:DNA polymerase, beta-like region n=1 Tax=Gallibacterium anatis (strain UMN179) TaxID=1005058 RepID=F4HFN2_GALAU|nr:nucleotidyltransferase [Gallibacterium anatis]AEC17073.1 DNA polymerase, beta-like region [Gallibacterium anatis UMN179]KGQ32047.1 DNA polymerase [Gallibacterium anatis]
MADYKSDYLNSVLESYRMKHIDDLVNSYRSKRGEIKQFLNEQYGSKIYEPFNSGSYKKCTAINTKFDLDLVVPFKHNAFATLEAMFEDVFEKLTEKYQNETSVKKQGVSIGLTFNEEDEINIDIVPARETSQDSFSATKNLNLHKTQGDGYLKTNIHAQIEHIKAKENERKVIRLLKIWKACHQYKYKSFFIELLVIKAYEKSSPQGNLWEQFKTVLNYIIDNIERENFTLKDPGNSNNDLALSLDSGEKSTLVYRLKSMLAQIELNEKQIEFYLPLNEKFSENNEEENKSYGLKSSALVSTPPVSQRFG